MRWPARCLIWLSCRHEDEGSAAGLSSESICEGLVAAGEGILRLEHSRIGSHDEHVHPGTKLVVREGDAPRPGHCGPRCIRAGPKQGEDCEEGISADRAFASAFLGFALNLKHMVKLVAADVWGKVKPLQTCEKQDEGRQPYRAVSPCPSSLQTRSAISNDRNAVTEMTSTASDGE